MRILFKKLLFNKEIKFRDKFFLIGGVRDFPSITKLPATSFPRRESQYWFNRSS